MVVEENKKIANVIQNVILENREKMSVSGVRDVLSFDDQIIIVDTELGMLTIKGDNLKINKLNIDTSDVSLEGNISSLLYTGTEFGNKKGQNSLIGKIFK